MEREQDYVLGCHDDELARLAVQHSLWRADCQRVWKWAGVGEGSRVLDIGCGPGVAAVDLAQVVGASGKVCGVEISEHYARHARAQLAGCPCGSSVEIMDLMGDVLPMQFRHAFDFAWSRWVSMFVPRPELVVAAARDALVPGGRAIFHEYTHYETYALHPKGSGVSRFVDAAVESIAQMGGDVNAGRRLPGLLSSAGFKVERVAAITRAILPDDPWWNWPAGFIRTYAPLLVERGQLAPADAQRAYDELDHAQREFLNGRASHYLVPPTVVEVVARV